MSVSRGHRQPSRAGARHLMCAGLLALSPATLAAQAGASAADTVPVLMLASRLGAGDSVVVRLVRGLVYRVEVSGPGMPEFRLLRGSRAPAFVAPALGGRSDSARAFEVYAVQSGPHAASLLELPPGTEGTLRIFEDTTLTRRVSERRDRTLAVGLLVAAGIHSGYRLDPTGGADPSGGADTEGAVVAETGDRLATCLGVGRQSFPDAGFTVTWAFIEERVTLLTRRWVARRRTDIGASLRVAHALKAGPRNLAPTLLAYGLHVTQHLSGRGSRRGWGLQVGWQHSRVGNAPETEYLDSDRLVAGVLWTP